MPIYQLHSDPLLAKTVFTASLRGGTIVGMITEYVGEWYSADMVIIFQLTVNL